MMIKKTVSFLLIFIFIFTLIPVTASAVEDYSSEAYEAVSNAIRNHESSVDVSAYGVSENELQSLMQHVFNNEPSTYYLKLSYSYMLMGSNVNKIIFVPKYEGEALQEAVDFVETEINAILATLPEGLDNYEKALYFHDYICVNFEYDVQGTYIADIYNMLKYKRGVCQAYTLLYDELLYRVGIDSRAVSSESLCHIWNQVNLGGEWYHVDVTWDDPISDVFAKAKHSYFLLSDSASEKIHEATDFESDRVSDDTSLDNKSWHSADTSFAFADGETYYIDGDTVKSIDLLTYNTEDIYTIDAVWTLPSGSYYAGDVFSGLGSYDGKLIFNTDKEIKYLDPETMEVGLVHAPELGDDNIYRMIVKGNQVYYMHSVEYSTDGEIDSCDIVFTAATPSTNPPATETPSKDETASSLGDIDANGKLEAFDYLLLKRAYFGTYKLYTAAKLRADIDHSGGVEAMDYILLKRAYFGTYKIQ